MIQITLQDAANDLAGLIRRARDGDVILIVDGTEVIARLEPVRRSKGPRKAGSMKDTLTVPARLMEPMTEEELREFWGGDPL